MSVVVSYYYLSVCFATHEYTSLSALRTVKATVRRRANHGVGGLWVTIAYYGTVTACGRSRAYEGVQ